MNFLSAGLVNADDDAALVGDEALLLASRRIGPVAVGANRCAAARLLVAAGCDLIISDDGLQHLALDRDCTVVVIDGARGFGNGALLPAGPLREPVARLRAADLVVMHGGSLHATLPAGITPLSMHLTALPLRRLDTGVEAPLQLLRGATVHAIAGVGNPSRFFALLRSLGSTPIEHPMPDHYRFRAEDLRFADRLPVVMTEKDAVKCRGLGAGIENAFYLPVTTVLPQADAARLLDKVLACLSTRIGATR